MDFDLDLGLDRSTTTTTTTTTGSSRNRFRQGGDFCSAFNCQNARMKESCKGLSFFKLPTTDGPRCRQWLQNIRRDDLHKKSLLELAKAKILLCASHFESNQFTVPKERKRLNWNAVPTIFDVPNPPKKIGMKRSLKEREALEPPPKKQHLDGHSDSGVHHDNEDPPTTSNLTLKAKLKTTRNQLYRANKEIIKAKSRRRSLSIAQVMEEMSRFLPAATADFVKVQIAMQTKKKGGRRWNSKEKALALSIYHASKKAYCLLHKLFILPSISTLKKAVRDINIYPGFSQPILSILSDKVRTMGGNSSLCCIVFDEMTIKEQIVYNPQRDEVEGMEDFGVHGRSRFVANHATVFMVRGLIIKWKQPVGYFLSSGPIKSTVLKCLIQDCVTAILNCGLDVKCVVADQGSNNRKAFQDLGVTEFQPFFFSF